MNERTGIAVLCCQYRKSCCYIATNLVFVDFIYIYNNKCTSLKTSNAF